MRYLSISIIGTVFLFLCTNLAFAVSSHNHTDHSAMKMQKKPAETHTSHSHNQGAMHMPKKMNHENGHNAHQHGGDAKGAGQKKDDEFIRIQSPTGFPVVIGKANPLPELPYEIVTGKDGTSIKVFKMTVKKVRFEIFPGKFLDGWGFNGSIPGPTIRVNEGDNLQIILTNETDTEHTLHVHGQKKNMASDGVPYLGQKPVEKGQSYTYSFTANNPGTHWYHCHVDSAHHVDMGMYGAFIVEPKQPTLVYDREYTLLLDEWPTAHKHIHEGVMPMKGHKKHAVVSEHSGMPPVHEQADETPANRSWYPKTYSAYNPVYDGFTINGRSFPFTEPLKVKSGEKILIRLINAGYKPHFMHTHSHKFTVVSRSGALVNEPQKIDTIMVGAGNRVDILLEADNPGTWPFHCHRLTHVANDHIYPGGMLTYLHYIDQ